MSGVTSPVLPPMPAVTLGDSSILKRKRSDIADRSPLKVVPNNSRPRPDAVFDVSDDDDDSEADEDGFRALSGSTSPSKRARPNPDHMAPASSDHEFGTTLPSTQCSIVLPPLTNLGHSVLNGNLVAAKPAAPGAVPSISQYGLRTLQTTCGKRHSIRQRPARESIPIAQLAAARSSTTPGRAQRSFYGIDIHALIESAEAAAAQPVVPFAAVPMPQQDCPLSSTEQPSAHEQASLGMMWTEKYRARKFTDLIGDDRTHRQVMHWLKRWDQIVFPGSKPRSRSTKNHGEQDMEERPHRKVMLLTGPPGLGKTTLAHVCARQAGYEVQEINASDERSKNVVHGRIRDMVGTENVRQAAGTSTANGSVRRAVRPVCVIVDEVDGAVSGTGASGEGGFIKALIDLLHTDQRNINRIGQHTSSMAGNKSKKKGDSFRMLRPLILICNDVYHPALRPLRQSSFAEIIHVGKAVLNNVASRLGSIFQREGVLADSDAVRRLCEASWGVTSRKEGNGGQGTAEGDIRSVLVLGEWVAGRFRCSKQSGTASNLRLTKRWVEDVFLEELSRSGGAARGLGRGGAKEIVDRVFMEGAGLNKLTSASAQDVIGVKITGVKGVAEAAKSRAIHKLREIITSGGDSDRVMMDCFSTYPDQPFHDDTMLTKPAAAYDWLFFHDLLASAVFQTNEWELAPYLCQPILAFHHLFATSKAAKHRYTRNDTSAMSAVTDAGPHPFCTLQASYAAHEAQKANTAVLEALQSTLSLPLTRSFPTPAPIATDLIPYISRILSPTVNPVLISGSGEQKHQSTASVRKASEKQLIDRAVNAMLATGVSFSRLRLEQFGAGNASDTLSTAGAGPVAAQSGASAHQTKQHAGWIYRMEPALDVYGTYQTASTDSKARDYVAVNNDVNTAGQRYAVRQILDQESKRHLARMDSEARQRRFDAGGSGISGANVDADARDMSGTDTKTIGRAGVTVQPIAARSEMIKRDFFGREIAVTVVEGGQDMVGLSESRKKRVWVSYNEGSSNAVRKPITLAEILAEFA